MHSNPELHHTTHSTRQSKRCIERPELKASGIERQALKIGDRAPSFTLFNQDHVQVVSNDLLREGPLVVSFFRGHW
jgi:hypothetical protein